MSYFLDTTTGIVTNEAGVQVAPAQSDQDPTYQAYVSWVNAGNQPTLTQSLSVSGARKITKFAFRSRFTAAEKVALELASLDNPSGTLEERQAAAMLRVFLKDIDTAEFINLDMEQTTNGVKLLEQKGLLGTGRANEILTGEIKSEEAWG